MRIPTGIIMFVVMILLSIVIAYSMNKFRYNNKERLENPNKERLENPKSNDALLYKLDVYIPTGTYILKVDTMEFLINNWKSSTSVIQIK